MKHLYKMKLLNLLFSFLFIFTLGVQAQKVTYDYDMAGNRISRKNVYLTSKGIKQAEETPAPVEEQLGERKITIYPNPTKGALALEITGGDTKDQMSATLYNAQGIQLQNLKIENSITPINMSTYPSAYYILRIQAGDKMTEFKIIKK